MSVHTTELSNPKRTRGEGDSVFTNCGKARPFDKAECDGNGYVVDNLSYVLFSVSPVARAETERLGNDDDHPGRLNCSIN
jgi:hypothetical protein